MITPKNQPLPGRRAAPFQLILALLTLLALLPQGSSPRTAPQPRGQQTTQDLASALTATSAPSLLSELEPLVGAYISDRDLGDGTRMASIHPVPINYQAEDGSWRPIDPRFEIAPGGFSNQTNLLRLRAGERLGSLWMGSGESVIGWDPRALVLNAAGAETVLATPLAPEQATPGQLSADRRTVHDRRRRRRHG